MIALKALLEATATRLDMAAGSSCQRQTLSLRAAKEPLSAGLIRGQTSAHRGLRTFAQDRLRNRRDLSAMSFSTALPSKASEAAIYLR